MGLRYAYELIADRAATGRLLTAMAGHLAAADRDRLLAAIAAHPHGMPTHVDARFQFEEPARHVSLKDGGVCFGFAFMPDDPLVDYNAESGMDPAPGRITVGCVYTHVNYGERSVVVRAAACTTSMSCLFRDSPSIWDTFVAIGRVGGAAVVLFDDAQGDGIECVWPHVGRLSPWADAEDFYTDNDDLTLTLQADRYAAAVLAAMPAV